MESKARLVPREVTSRARRKGSEGLARERELRRVRGEGKGDVVERGRETREREREGT